jgi:hypothetical protein
MDGGGRRIGRRDISHRSRRTVERPSGGRRRAGRTTPAETRGRKRREARPAERCLPAGSPSRRIRPSGRLPVMDITVGRACGISLPPCRCSGGPDTGVRSAPRKALPTVQQCCEASPPLSLRHPRLGKTLQVRVLVPPFPPDGVRSRSGAPGPAPPGPSPGVKTNLETSASESSAEDLTLPAQRDPPPERFTGSRVIILVNVNAFTIGS